MKKILFVITGLGLGGAQKSLVNLLNSIDISKFDIDVLLFDDTQNTLEKDITIPVHFLKIKGVGALYFLPVSKGIRKLVASKKILLAFKRVFNPMHIKLMKKKKYPEQIIWNNVKDDIEKLNQYYDIAIAYCQGLPTFFVIDKVSATYKIAWMHSDAAKQVHDVSYTLKYYQKYNLINCVSDKAAESLKKLYPSVCNRISTFNNIVDISGIQKLAKEKSEFDLQKHALNICTVGRLCEAKGYYLAIETAVYLREKDLDFIWYVVGEGGLRDNLVKKINENGLQNQFIILGASTNPYAVIDFCDIYVQTSLWEGYCITLAEARCLNKPIITTDFSGASEQILNQKNGLICKHDAKILCEKIVELYNCPKLRLAFSAYLQANPNKYENKFEFMIENLGENKNEE